MTSHANKRRQAKDKAGGQRRPTKLHISNIVGTNTVDPEKKDRKEIEDNNTSQVSGGALASWPSDSRCTYNGDVLHFQLGLSLSGGSLFEATSFSLVRGKVTGLVGTNGAGKTSLARVIVSKQLPGFPSDLTIIYLSSHENHIFSDEEEGKLIPESYILKIVEKKLERLQNEIETLENSPDEDPEIVEENAVRLSELCDKYDELQASSKHQIKQTLEELGFGPYLHRSVRNLSSGWKYKCALAGAFIAKPDILVIDEPSFLDAASTKWLIAKLQEAEK